MAQIASLLVPGVNIPQPDNSWLGGIADSIGGAIQNVRADRSFNGLADRLQGGASPAGQQQSGGFLSGLLGRSSQPTQTAPIAPVSRSALQGETFQPFINTVKAGGLTNPYGLAAVASTVRAESGWDTNNFTRTWSDPSERGRPGVSGGAMSWRGPRYQALAATGDLSPAGQARFFLQEDPNLIAALQSSKSIEEAQGLINKAWAFAGHDRPSAEVDRRLGYARSYLPTFQGGAEVASVDPSAGMSAASAIEAIAPASGYVDPGLSAQPQQPAFDMGRFGAPMNLAEMPPTRADIAPQMQRQTAGLGQPALRPFQPGERRNNPDGSYSTEITTTWQLPDGSWVNAPSLWMGQNGPQQFDPNDEEGILGALQQYEAQNGQAFQRYGSAQEAEAAAQQRSAAGGVESAPYTMASPTAPQAAAPMQVADASGGSSMIAQGITPVQRGGVDPSIIQYMLRDRNLRDVGLKLWAANAEGQKPGEPWQFVNLPDGTLARANQQTGAVERLGNFAKQAGQGGAEYGLAPIYGTDANGNTVIGQLAKDGTFQQTKLPEGFQPTPGISNSDLGTTVITRNNRTGRIIDTQNKDVAGTADQTATGKAQAEARAALPAAQASADQMLATIDSLYNDPYLANMLGPIDSRTPNITTDAARVQGKMEQIGGQAFLQAFNMLKGGGAITEVEGLKATQAMARLNTAQSEKDYKEALDDLRGVIERGVANARAKANATYTDTPAGQLPMVRGQADYDSLPSGTQYTDPNGNIRTKR